MHDLLDKEELKWKKQSKEVWLKEGDRNKKYFHACANQRRRYNYIESVQDEQGIRWESTEGCRVTNEMNDMLDRDFTKEEIFAALQQMSPHKAPGQDGYMAGFYQENWEVGDEVIANRLKVVLPHLISPNQSAFISGQLITYNMLAAYETLHTMHTRMWGKEGFMAIKLYMSKAYDRVEWCFLEAVMRRLSFTEKWINIIMMCVRSISYANLVNGNPVGHIYPSRELRQGDPVSPYLFMICAEALSSLLSRADQKGNIRGVPTSKKGHRLNHLFFADDSLLFCRAGKCHWNRLTKLLKSYEDASGQKLNKEKTDVFFRRNTSNVSKQKILDISGIPLSQRFDTYLGLPALVGKSRTAAFKNIKDRVWKRLQDWKLKFLSQARKESLI
ncbi:uncharacterized protein LOC132177961 [Corylus avellana]|uniref:uncharacterized protein LOC132177961 n=1 Tax=Corylus avellana TaxID=13451 RepID=UPI00286AE4F4|nr:uncharacterized protein LOC132177961 [Corylus avellana]